MSEVIIYVLEVIHVDTCNGDPSRCFLIVIEHRGDPLFKAAPVVDARQRVPDIKIHDVADLEILVIELNPVDRLAREHQHELQALVDELVGVVPAHEDHIAVDLVLKVDRQEYPDLGIISLELLRQQVFIRVLDPRCLDLIPLEKAVNEPAVLTVITDVALVEYVKLLQRLERQHRAAVVIHDIHVIRAQTPERQHLPIVIVIGLRKAVKDLVDIPLHHVSRALALDHAARDFNRLIGISAFCKFR